MTTDELKNIKDRIRKLFALANDAGASESEAQTAMRMAMGLMAKHGIEQNALGTEKPKIRERLQNKAAQDFEMTLAQAAAVLYGCRVIRYNAGSGKHYPSFVGRDDNIDAAEMTMMWLVQQVEAMYKQALPRGLTVPARAEFRRTFKHACSVRVYGRAVKLTQDPGAMVEITGSTALVVAGYFDQLKAENDDYLSGMALKTTKARGKRIGTGTRAGYDAGNRVQLHRRVGA